MKTNQEARKIKLFNFFQNRLKTDLSIPAKYTQTVGRQTENYCSKRKNFEICVCS